MVLANTSKILTNQIDLSSKLRADIDNLHSSILALIEGKLTPTFLPKLTSSYPVPINSTASRATNILHLPTWFAVTSHQQFYTTFTTADLETCQHEPSNIHCNFNKALTPVTSPSCTIGLLA